MAMQVCSGALSGGQMQWTVFSHEAGVVVPAHGAQARSCDAFSYAAFVGADWGTKTRF